MLELAPNEHQHVLPQRILEGDAICDHVVEQTIDIVPIGACRSCRHTQEELGLEVLKNLAVASRSRSVSLVDHNVVVLAGIEFVPMLRKSADHREPACFGAEDQVLAVNPIRETIPQDAPVAFSRRLQNSFAVRYKENFGGLGLANIECRQVSYRSRTWRSPVFR